MATGCDDVKFNSAHMKNMSERNLEFALDLYQTMVQDQGDESNLFCSPFSVMAALSMTFVGARGNTAAEMRRTMKLDTMSSENVHVAFEDIMESLNILRDQTSADVSVPAFTLNCANRMYTDRSYKILEEFVATLVKHYRTEPMNVDFVNNVEATRTAINSWVEEVTRNKIRNLLAPGAITELTRMVLINAIYFKGNWSRPFNVDHTRDGNFFLNSRDKIVTVRMMNICDKFLYAENADLRCKLLELPYTGDRLSMLLILPNEVDGLEALERRICNANAFIELRKSVDRVKVSVRIPKFKLESTAELSSNVLRHMGIQDLFCDGKADLSGITGNKDVHVSAVFHKAFVDVNEEGTEAAAATAIVLMARRLEERCEFVADHPFVFFIYDKKTEMILFAGRLVDPVPTTIP